ncbi:GntR family transcriptional regulator [Phytohabitans sp. ZYX-F-186]|uniref:GntR family transcriptional regulator n=1 Tax=Phytohabitans maris TaxID=3071409 RepID=A0ABU0ZVN7_9ACTN|nr:GntR family transcriptional regulator [Phytohabitans sp. ZYX-F-186]MDQ7910389.1 GntR family transcriptional regulator [Phytohabitans sp. ZYX-F-186]
MATRYLLPDAKPGDTVQERVKLALREAITSGDLAPGAKLHQASIAKSMHVSVTPVREALRDLAAEGLIALDAHRGARVRLIELDEFLEIRQLMEFMEPLCARLAAERVTDTELATLHAIQDQLERVTAASDYLPLNADFHDYMTTAAKAPRLAAILAPLRVASRVVIMTALGTVPSRVEQGIEEHRPILAALSRRDGDAAAEATLRHLAPTWDAVEALCRSRAAGTTTD